MNKEMTIEACKSLVSIAIENDKEKYQLMFAKEVIEKLSVELDELEAIAAKWDEPQMQAKLELAEAILALENEQDQLANIVWYECCDECRRDHKQSMNTKEIIERHRAQKRGSE